MPYEVRCELLDWDSTFFGVTIASLTGVTKDSLDWETVHSWCRERSVDCLYCLIDCSADSGGLLDYGFVPVDVRLTLERTLDPQAVHVHSAVRPATAADILSLKEIAAVSHSATRFFADPRFRPRAPALYETWIEKSVRGMADVVLVPNGPTASGYITCNRRADAVGEIGLLAVAAAWRGQGVGRELINGALAWQLGAGCRTARVVAQAGNLPALAAYERAGFTTARTQRWYHRWF